MQGAGNFRFLQFICWDALVIGIYVRERDGESVKAAENIRTFKTTAFKEKGFLM